MRQVAGKGDAPSADNTSGVTDQEEQTLPEQ